MESRRRLRSASTTALIVPRTEYSIIGDRAFPVAAARAWNSLSSFVASSPSLQVFKRRLKTESQSMLNDRANSSVLSRRLKTCNDGDDVTNDDRLFHTRAAATGKAQSPIVECSVRGTINAVVDADRRRRRDSMSATPPVSPKYPQTPAVAWDQ